MFIPVIRTHGSTPETPYLLFIGLLGLKTCLQTPTIHVYHSYVMAKCQMNIYEMLLTAQKFPNMLNSLERSDGKQGTTQRGWHALQQRADLGQHLFTEIFLKIGIKSISFQLFSKLRNQISQNTNTLVGTKFQSDDFILSETVYIPSHHLTFNIIFVTP